MAKAVINGRVVEFEPGISILDASRAIGVDIPTLCHDERLKPIGSCHDMSRGHLCVKGRYAFDFVSASDRITQPMIRKGDKWQQTTWDDAISVTAESLRRIPETHGPDSIGVLGSARGTNEESHLAQKFARVVIGTNNVDCCARVCHTPTAAAMKLTLGTGAATNSYNDIERAQTFSSADLKVPNTKLPLWALKLNNQER